MSFILYELNSSLEWQRLRQLSLSGKKGAIATFLTRQQATGEEVLRWQITEHEILEFLGSPDPQKYAVLLDRAGALWRVRKLWVVAHAATTDVLLQLEHWRTGDRDIASAGSAYALLQLNGGARNDAWTWAGGRLHVSFVPDDAMRFFIESIEAAQMHKDLEELFGSRSARPEPFPLPMPPLDAGFTPEVANRSVPARIEASGRALIRKVFAYLKINAARTP
jgi:hypothetical protein